MVSPLDAYGIIKSLEKQIRSGWFIYYDEWYSSIPSYGFLSILDY